jgi:Fe-S cluster biogenesis protein NfuA
MSEPNLAQKLQQLVAAVQALSANDADESGLTRERWLQQIQTVLDFHHAALAQLLDLIRREGDVGRRILENATLDGLVANLLLLHGLHPTDLEARACQALDQVRPFLHSQGAEVTLVAVADDAVRLRLDRNGTGYPASPQMLQAAIEETIAAAAPDVRLIEFMESDSAEGTERTRTLSRFPLPLVAQPTGHRTA